MSTTCKYPAHLYTLEFEMPLDAQRARDRARRFEFPRVALTVVNREGVQRKALRPGHRRRRVRIEAAAQQDYGSHRVIG